MPRGTLIVVSGPSGVGKSTLLKRALESTPELVFSVSLTTRPPRDGERDGIDYCFVDLDEFERLASEGQLLERAVVHGQHYGTPRDAVHELQGQGRTVILDIDTQGADQVRASGEPATFVFVLPPDFESLQQRLTSRGTEDPTSITMRLGRARSEMERASDYEFVLINDDLERSFQHLQAMFRAIILRSARDELIEETLRPRR